MPAHEKGLATIQHPWPVHTMIDFCREVLDFLVGKILPCSENAAQKNRGVDRGELAFGPAIAGFHVDEMKEETRSEEHTSELQSLRHLVCRLLLEKKKEYENQHPDYRSSKQHLNIVRQI